MYTGLTFIPDSYSKEAVSISKCIKVYHVLKHRFCLCFSNDILKAFIKLKTYRVLRSEELQEKIELKNHFSEQDIFKIIQGVLKCCSPTSNLPFFLFSCFLTTRLYRISTGHRSELQMLYYTSRSASSRLSMPICRFHITIQNVIWSKKNI